MCTTDDASDFAALRDHIAVRLRYAPLSSGTHTVSVVPFTTNNTELPAPLVLTGTAN